MRLVLPALGAAGVFDVVVVVGVAGVVLVRPAPALRPFSVGGGRNDSCRVGAKRSFIDSFATQLFNVHDA